MDKLTLTQLIPQLYNISFNRVFLTLTIVDIKDLLKPTRSGIIDSLCQIKAEIKACMIGPSKD